MKERKEGEIVPMGTSYTESDKNVYIYYREDDRYVVTKVPKNLGTSERYVEFVSIFDETERRFLYSPWPLLEGGTRE